jgi:hypothetical protein
MPVFTDYGVSKPTTLSDMLGNLNTLQQYQQSQQLMPLQLEKARLELERQQATQKSEIEKSKSLSREQLGKEQPNITVAEQDALKAQIEARKAQYDLTGIQAEHMNDELGALIPNKDIQNINPKDPKSVKAAKDAVIAAQERLVGRGIDKGSVEAHLRPIYTLIDENPEALGQALTNIVQRGQNTQQFAQANLSPTVISQGTKQTLQPTSLFQPNRQAESLQTNPAPGSFVEVNNIKYQVGENGVLTPVKIGAPAAAAPAAIPASGVANPQGGPLPAGMALPPATNGIPAGLPNTSAIKPNMQDMPKIALDMPIAAGGIPQLNTQQQARYETGMAKKDAAIAADKVASDSDQNIRKIYENLGAATGSQVGQVARNLATSIAGNPSLNILAKNLAMQQLANETAFGAPTNAARETVQNVSGSTEIDPKALKDIADRAYATNTASHAYTAGLKAFMAKHGPYNGPIHEQNYRAEFNANYDIRNFMLQNINKSNLSPIQKDFERAKLFGDLTPQEAKELQRKQKMMKRIERGEFQ